MQFDGKKKKEKESVFDVLIEGRRVFEFCLYKNAHNVAKHGRERV